MKKQLQKKHKIMIGAGAGLLGAAAVATPLTIVLTQQDKHINQLNFDKKYGLDKAQYNKMKTNLLNAYSAELDAESIADKEARMAKLTRQFNSLDNAIKQSNKSINTYFTATSSLLALNKEINKGLEKGVVLTRESRAN
ncbi:MAG: hypothetical protein MJ200_04060 [Mycoplasmoidaceae bacterium]|nr:hypothetical protein [Mycoplasmoidaceae bacterium]